MALEIFWGSGSPYGWRVILTAEFKQIDYVSRLLQFSSRDHKSDAYLALNPRGTFPLLVDGDAANDVNRKRRLRRGSRRQRLDRPIHVGW